MVYPTHNENLSKLTHPVTHKKVASQITQMRVKRQNLTPQNEANQKNLKLNKKGSIHKVWAITNGSKRPKYLKERNAESNNFIQMEKTMKGIERTLYQVSQESNISQDSRRSAREK